MQLKNDVRLRLLYDLSPPSKQTLWSSVFIPQIIQIENEIFKNLGVFIGLESLTWHQPIHLAKYLRRVSEVNQCGAFKF